ncbi:unnamed protein product [Amoebophrya sp. A25]|nr:unnamed protein product [Amoebophrya sp. A25]|eukprot:GSA25T00002299001.1
MEDQDSVRVCKHFARTGNCRYGATCRFAHVVVEGCEKKVPDGLKNGFQELAGVALSDIKDTATERQRRPCGRLVTRNAGKSHVLRRFIHEKFIGPLISSSSSQLDEREKDLDAEKKQKSRRRGLQVLDVAGGKGELGFELLLLSHLVTKVVIVDPRPLDLRKCRRRFDLSLYTRSDWAHVDLKKHASFQQRQGVRTRGTLDHEGRSPSRRITENCATAKDQDRVETRDIEHNARQFSDVGKTQSACSSASYNGHEDGRLQETVQKVHFSDLSEQLESCQLRCLLRRELWAPLQCRGASGVGEGRGGGVDFSVTRDQVKNDFAENLKLSAAWDWKKHDRGHETETRGRWQSVILDRNEGDLEAIDTKSIPSRGDSFSIFRRGKWSESVVPPYLEETDQPEPEAFDDAGVTKNKNRIRSLADSVESPFCNCWRSAPLSHFDDTIKDSIAADGSLYCSPSETEETEQFQQERVHPYSASEDRLASHVKSVDSKQPALAWTTPISTPSSPCGSAVTRAPSSPSTGSRSSREPRESLVQECGHVLHRAEGSLSHDEIENEEGGQYQIDESSRFLDVECVDADESSRLLDAYRKVIARSDLVVGMHPDQAAEAIVDLALHYNIPFFVVPCCVYAKEFPKRHLLVDDVVDDGDGEEQEGGRLEEDAGTSTSPRSCSVQDSRNRWSVMEVQHQEAVTNLTSIPASKETSCHRVSITPLQSSVTTTLKNPNIRPPKRKKKVQVKSYAQLLDYLQAKHPAIRRDVLEGIQGKNSVLWKV